MKRGLEKQKFESTSVYTWQSRKLVNNGWELAKLSISIFDL